jgi:hypothetical protein
MFVVPIPLWVQMKKQTGSRSYIVYNITASLALFISILLPWWWFDSDLVLWIGIVGFFILRRTAAHQIYKIYRKRRANDSNTDISS